MEQYSSNAHEDLIIKVKGAKDLVERLNAEYLELNARNIHTDEEHSRLNNKRSELVEAEMLELDANIQLTAYRFDFPEGSRADDAFLTELYGVV